MISGTVTGNLGQDAELRFTQGSGDAVLSFSVASNEKTGKGEKLTTWVRCTIWGKRGEALVQYLRKGTYVVAAGSISQREYEPRDGGAKRMSLEMRVSELDFRSDDRDGRSAGTGGDENRAPAGGGYGGGGYDRGAPTGGGAARSASGNGRSAGARAPSPPADAGGQPPADDAPYGAGGGNDDDIPFATSRGTR